MMRQPSVGQGLHIVEASRSHSDTPHSVGRLWTSNRLDEETYTWQQTTLTETDIYTPGGIRFEAAIPARERPQIHTLDRATTWGL